MSQSNTGAVAFVLILVVPTAWYLALFPDISFRDERFVDFICSAFICVGWRRLLLSSVRLRPFAFVEAA